MASPIGFGLLIRVVKRLLALLLIALSLSPAYGAWSLRGCATALNHIFNSRAKNTPQPSDLNAEEIETFKKWTNSHRFSAGFMAAAINGNHVNLALSELPLSIRAKLFAMNEGFDRYEWGEIVTGRLKKLGIFAQEVPPLYAAIKRSERGEDTNHFKRIETQIDTFEKQGAAHRDKIASDYQKVREVSLLKKKFEEYAGPEYRLRFEGNEVVFPDGVRYRFEKLWSGKIRIWVKFKNILRTQEFESPETVASYVAGRFQEEGGFEDLVAPDGRVLLYDAHHRTQAYVQRHRKKGQTPEETLVPFLISAHTDGFFYTVSHWSILKSKNYVALPREILKWAKDASWSFLPEEERESFLALCRQSPIRAFQELYYRETKLPRLTLGDR